MKPENPVNNLYQTILSLNGTDNEISAGFVSALNTFYPGGKFTFSNSSSQDPASSLKVSTGGKIYGYLNYSFTETDSDSGSELANAAAMLALLLENRSQAEVISKLKKSRNGEERTAEQDERLTMMAAISPAVISEYTITPGMKLV